MRNRNRHPARKPPSPRIILTKCFSSKLDIPLSARKHPSKIIAKTRNSNKAVSSSDKISSITLFKLVPQQHCRPQCLSSAETQSKSTHSPPSRPQPTAIIHIPHLPPCTIQRCCTSTTHYPANFPTCTTVRSYHVPGLGPFPGGGPIFFPCCCRICSCHARNCSGVIVGGGRAPLGTIGGPPPCGGNPAPFRGGSAAPGGPAPAPGYWCGTGAG